LRSNAGARNVRDLHRDLVLGYALYCASALERVREIVERAEL
jgi:hypothetical protein